MSAKIVELTKFGTAARIVFDDQDVETDWAYLRLGYEDSNPFQKFNWFKARAEPFGFDLIIDDDEEARLEAIYQEHLKEQQQ